MISQRIVKTLLHPFLAVAMLFSLLLSTPTRADVVVLLHGYMGSPDSFEKSGVNAVLESAGWGRGGIIVPDIGEFYPGPQPDAKNVAYLVDLPWMLPLREQSEFFALAIKSMGLQKDETI